MKEERLPSQPQDIKFWIRQRLTLDPPSKIFDGRSMMTEKSMAEAVKAAVLIPLVNKPEGIQVLLTQRTLHLYNHAGQISFPGGRIDPEDTSSEITALRETEEEIGLHRGKIEILGSLRDYFIPTGFKVSPYVGWIDGPVELSPDPFEVDQVFEVPLSYFLNPQHHYLKHDEYQGRQRRYYVFEYEDKYIWGATAGMMVDLYHTLGSP